MFEGVLLNPSPVSLKIHTIRALLENNLTWPRLAYGEQLLEHTAKRCSELNLDEIPRIQEFGRHVPLFDHAVVTCFLAGILIQTLNYESDRWKERIGLAALFHHIGFLRNGKNHVEDALTLLNEIEGFDVAILQAIERHHERQAFLPYRMAEIVGLSSALASLFEKHRAGELSDPLHAFAKSQLHDFSPIIVSSFNSAFLNINE